MDQRDEPTWVVIEITSIGESKTLDGTLERSIREDLDVGNDHPIFIPVRAVSREGQSSKIISVIDGYVFVASGLPEVDYFRLENQPYVQQVLSVRTGPHQMRCLSTVPNADIEDLKSKLVDMLTVDIPVGSRVLVEHGIYEGLEGEVMDHSEDGENSFIKIDMESLSTIATLPRSFLSELPSE